MKINDVMPHIWADIHQSIGDASAGVVHMLGRPVASDSAWYPPGVELTSDEQIALANLQLNLAAKSGLLKLIGSASAASLFNLFTLLDGVADPTNFSGDVWLGGEIVLPGEEDREMLHDEFLDSYPL